MMEYIFYIRTGENAIKFTLFKFFSIGFIHYICEDNDSSHILCQIILWKLELNLELGIR